MSFTRSRSGKDEVQKRACEVFRRALVSPRWGDLLKRRRDYYFTSAPEFRVESARCILEKGFGLFNLASAVKTICGAWHTSHRMHEQNKKVCLLGCGGVDDLRHYAACALWRRLFNEVPELACGPREELFHVRCVAGAARCARGFQIYSLLKFRTSSPSFERAKEFLAALGSEYPYKAQS